MCLCGVCMSKGLCVCLSVCVHVLSGAHIHVEIDIGSFSLSLSTLFVQTWSPAAPELIDSVYLACDLQDPPVFSHYRGGDRYLQPCQVFYPILGIWNQVFIHLWHVLSPMDLYCQPHCDFGVFLLALAFSKSAGRGSVWLTPVILFLHSLFWRPQW